MMPDHLALCCFCRHSSASSSCFMQEVSRELARPNLGANSHHGSCTQRILLWRSSELALGVHPRQQSSADPLCRGVSTRPRWKETEDVSSIRESATNCVILGKTFCISLEVFPHL